MNDSFEQSGSKTTDSVETEPHLDDQPTWLLPTVLAGGAVVALLVLVVAVAMWRMVRQRDHRAIEAVASTPADQASDSQPQAVNGDRESPDASASEEGDSVNEVATAAHQDQPHREPSVTVPDDVIPDQEHSPEAAEPTDQHDRLVAPADPRAASDAADTSANAEPSVSSPPSSAASVERNDDGPALARPPEGSTEGVLTERVTMRASRASPASKSVGNSTRPGLGRATPAAPAGPALDSADTLPQPAPDTLDDAGRQLTEAVGGRLEEATTAEAKRDLAESLISEAVEERDGALRYVMLDRARQLAAQAGDVRLPFAAITQIQRTYDADVLPLKVDVVETLTDTAESAESRRALARIAADVGEEAAAAEQFEVAEEMVATGLRFAPEIEDNRLQRTITEQLKQIEEDAAQCRSAAEARERLALAADDAEAHLALGKYLCFAKEDWAAGLSHLAKGGDPALADVADLESQAPDDPRALVRLADDWYDWGNDHDGAERTGAWSRARDHYQAAYPGLAGALRQRVDDRLEALADALGGTYTPPPVVARLPWLDGPVGQLQTFDGHSENITALAVSQSGNLLASAAEDLTVRLWHLPTGKRLWRHGTETSNLNGVAITPDERFVISNHDNNQFTVLDASTGKPTGQIPTSSRSPSSLAVTPDGERLIWATRSRPPNILIWSLLHGRPLAQFGDGEYPSVLDVSTDGRFIATGDSRGMVRLWDTVAGTAVRQYSVHEDAVTDLDLSPRGSAVAAATYDKIAVVDLDTGQSVFVFEKPSIRTIALSPDGLRLVSGGFREEVFVWDVTTGHQLASLKAERAFSDRHILRLAFLPDPRGLVTGATDGRIRLWRLPD